MSTDFAITYVCILCQCVINIHVTLIDDVSLLLMPAHDNFNYNYISSIATYLKYRNNSVDMRYALIKYTLINLMRFQTSSASVILLLTFNVL